MASTSSATTASAASSSADAAHHHGFGSGFIPSPPPPTPSNQSVANSLPADADGALSRLLHQLLVIPTLSQPMPPRRSQRTASPPVISLGNRQQSDLLLSASSDFGFFHLTGHGVTSDLAASALEESKSLLRSKWIAIKNLFSLGFDHDYFDEDDGESLDHNDQDRILLLDSSGDGDVDGLSSLPAMREFGKCLEKLGLGVVDMLSSMEGGLCENPFEKRNCKPRFLLWASSHGNDNSTGKFGSQLMDSKCSIYPYIVGLQYEMSWWKQPCTAVGDSGERLSITPIADSILVTLGDIAQVWSNGKFKKVRSRPQPNSLPFSGCDYSCSISLTLLVTLSLDSVITPLLPLEVDCVGDDDDNIVDNNRKRFRDFSLEEYAWRVYHERFPLKDPLLRYRI